MASLTNKDHQYHFGQTSNQPNAGNRWKDLGETHIVRAASVYTNIPLSKTKQLSAVLKKAQDKTLV